MDIIPVCAITAGGIIFLLLLNRLHTYVVRFVGYLSVLVSKHLTYPYLLRRHRFYGPWSRAGVALQTTFISINLFCINFIVSIFPVSIRWSKPAEAGSRAGTLALIILIPLLAGAYHALLADLIGLSLQKIRLIHRSIGLAMSLLCLLHVLLALASKDLFSLDNTQDLFAVIGGSSLGLLLLLAFPIVRKLSYEVFLRTHQALSLLLTFAIWQHLPSDKNFPRGYIYISSGLYVAMLILQAGSVVFHNGIFRHHLSRAALTHDNGAVKIRLKLQKPLEIGPGTYINLWIPAVSFGAFLQSHPFMVISWGPGKQHIIDLLIEPQRGLTRDLLYHAKRDHAADFLVIFSGPHGTSVPMDEYESILMVASGFGIATHLPYLKGLIYGYNSRRVQARRIHLVWQIRHKADAVVAQSLLNDALKDDRLDDGCILSISIYLESNDIPTFPFGKRATIYPGVAPLSGIFLEEVLGKHIKKPEVDTIQYGTKAIGLRNLKTIVEDAEDIESMDQRKSAREGKMLVTVSGYDDIRDQLRGLTREYLEEGVSLVELDYQPK